MLTLNRDAFLAIKRPDPVMVTLPDGVIYVRVMTAREREQYETVIRKKTESGKADDVRAEVVQRCACDADGNLLFTAADLPLLADLPFTVINPIFEAATTANSMQAGAVEQAEKN